MFDTRRDTRLAFSSVAMTLTSSEEKRCFMITDGLRDRMKFKEFNTDMRPNE